MSIATRATSHTRGAGLPHLGQATDTWLQRTCRIAHGTAPTAEQLGSTDEGPRRATTGPLLRQFRTLVLRVRLPPKRLFVFDRLTHSRNRRPVLPKYTRGREVSAGRTTHSHVYRNRFAPDSQSA